MPAGHSALMPATQKEPAAHTTGAALPPAQEEPVRQAPPEAAVEPAAQKEPTAAVQGPEQAEVVRPVAEPKEPTGHRATTVLLGQ